MFENMSYEVSKSFKNKYQYILKDNKIKYYELNEKFKMQKVDEYKDDGHSERLYEELIEYYNKNKPESFETNFNDKDLTIDFYYAKQIFNGEKIKTTTFNCKFKDKKSYKKIKKQIEKSTKKFLKKK